MDKNTVDKKVLQMEDFLFQQELKEIKEIAFPNGEGFIIEDNELKEIKKENKNENL